MIGRSFHRKEIGIPNRRRVACCQARAMAVRTRIRIPRMAGLGRRRSTCQTTMLIDRILRSGETANESSKDLAGRRFTETTYRWPIVCRSSAGKQEVYGTVTTTVEADCGRYTPADVSRLLVGREAFKGARDFAYVVGPEAAGAAHLFCEYLVDGG